MKILVIDDEPGIRHVCERALRRAGHEVVSCVSGEDALPRLAEKWDLVLTDLTMPGRVDGNELLRRARAAGGADVVLMTANPTLASSISAIKDGACDYLLKPFTLASLLDLVRRREECQREARRPIQTFGRFLSPQVARHVLESPVDLLETRELRTVTVLFADLRGFTPFTEKAGPEEAARRLNELLPCIIEAVHGEGGTLAQFTGDGAMAVFGAPIDHKEPAAAAARAALRARLAALKLGPLQFGFGINSGQAAVGCLGTQERAEYSVVGSVVNIASRITAKASPGEILLGPAARQALDERFVCAPAKPIEYAGINGPLAVSELLGLAGS